MQTLQKLTLLFTEEQSTFLQEDSRVNRFHKQENEKAKKMRDTSGQKCLEQLERFNRVGLWEKMFLELLIGTKGWYSKRCSLTWKMRGTKCNRLYFQLVPSMRHIDETGLGLLPTPTVTNILSKERCDNNMDHNNLI